MFLFKGSENINVLFYNAVLFPLTRVQASWLKKLYKPYLHVDHRDTFT